MLARAFARLNHEVWLVNVQPSASAEADLEAGEDGVKPLETAPGRLPEADLHVVVGLWDERTRETARELARRKARLVLAPTVYWHENLLPDLASEAAEALWYVSWDQAAWAREYWYLAKRVEVVRCAVDVEVFRPAGRQPNGDPWMLGRHSRDVPAKFSPDIPEYVQRLGEKHRIRFRMLGASRSMSWLEDRRVAAYREDAVAPREFLQQCDVWVYAHAPYWRETACLAMLEAMASGLPVIVDNLGGMREYVQHGVTGFLCNGVEEFVRHTALVLEIPGLYEELGRNARRAVEERHSLESLTQELRRRLEGY
jgi:glycosyltransferase involved in cell wall biosynthesis